MSTLDRLALPVTAVAALAFALAGCGAHKPTNGQALARQQVTQTVHAYIRAQTAGDGPAACALLTTGARQQLSTLVMRASNGMLKAPPSCEDAVGLIRAIAGAGVLAALRQASVEQVQIRGEDATARVVDGAAFSAQQVSLRRVGGAWKIAAVPGLGG